MVRSLFHALVVTSLVGCGSGEVLLPVPGAETEADEEVGDGEAEGETEAEEDGDADEADGDGADGEGDAPVENDGTDSPDDGVTGAGIMLDPEPIGPSSDIVDVSGGDFQVGEAPASSGAAAVPVILGVTAPPAVTNGGSATLLITLAAPVEAPTFVVSLAGDSGFHTVAGTDSNGDGVYEIDVQVSGDAAQPSLVLSVAATDAAGNVGEYHEVTLELVQSGVGDVKITLSFDRTHDLDLHVFEPMGEEISFMNRASANGGQLDLDSGANCDATTGLSENVFWPRAQAPTGAYRVMVHNYAECSEGDIAYSVRIAHDDQIKTYRGTFASGSAGTVAEVATFTR